MIHLIALTSIGLALTCPPECTEPSSACGTRVYTCKVASDDLPPGVANGHGAAFVVKVDKDGVRRTESVDPATLKLILDGVKCDDAGIASAFYADKPAVFAVARAAEDVAAGLPRAGDPWLGVQFTLVPESLAAQLGADHGALILNVVKDSPAARAGLRKNDVVIAIDGAAIEEISTVRDVIANHAVDDVIALDVLREGRRQAINVRIGGRPESTGAMAYLYESPNPTITQFESVLPRFWTMDENGKLVEPDEDQIHRLHEMLPMLQQKGANLFAPGPNGLIESRHSIVIQRDLNGDRMSIRRNDDGSFVVERTDKDGNKTKGEYGTEADFEAADPDAFAMYNDSVHFDIQGMAPNAAMGADIEAHIQKLHDHLSNKMQSLDFSQLTDESVKQSIEQALQQMEGSLKDLDLGALKTGHAIRIGKAFSASTSIVKSADGTIRVTTRDGDAELVEEYADENQLANERPEIFERYMKLRDTARTAPLGGE
jgi:hypothetical protein